MRVLWRVGATIAAAILVAALSPALPSAAHHQPGHGSMEVTVGDSANHRFQRQCEGFFTSSQPPFACDIVQSTRLVHQFRLLNKPSNFKNALEVHWEIVEISAAQGVDYAGPASGTVTIPANGTVASLVIPILDDGNPGGPDKTLEVQITGTSAPAVAIGDPGTGTIRAGGNPPADCSLERPDVVTTIATCTDRPAGQSWRISTLCLSMAGHMGGGVGNLVTGNGTSTAVCNVGGFAEQLFWGAVS